MFDYDYMCLLQIHMVYEWMYERTSGVLFTDNNLLANIVLTNKALVK